MNDNTISHQAMMVVQDMVTEFYEAFDQTPEVALSLDLVVEEAEELIEAAIELEASPSVNTAGHFAKEAADFLYVLVGLKAALELAGFGPEDQTTLTPQQKNSMGLATALLDSSKPFFKPGDLLDSASLVHASNMSKLNEDGNPILDPDSGKILKGSHYQEPDMDEIGTKVFVAFMKLRMDRAA